MILDLLKHSFCEDKCLKDIFTMDFALLVNRQLKIRFATKAFLNRTALTGILFHHYVGQFLSKD